MNSLSKFASIFVIVIASLALVSFIYLCFVGEFEFRWLITALFCIFLIIVNVIELRKGGSDGQ